MRLRRGAGADARVDASRGADEEDVGAGCRHDERGPRGRLLNAIFEDAESRSAERFGWDLGELNRSARRKF